MILTNTLTAVKLTLSDSDVRIARLVPIDGEFCETCSTPIVDLVAVQLAFDDDPDFTDSCVIHVACLTADNDDTLKIVKAVPFTS